MVFSKTTELDEIKARARVFVYTDVKFDDELGVYVTHPFFKTVIDGLQMGNKVELIDLRKPEDLKKKRSRTIDKINSATSYSQLLSLFRLNFLPAFFKLTHLCLSADEYSEALARIWTTVEHPNLDINVKPKEFIKYFRSARKEKLMNEGEYQAYKELPDKITVYRGINDYGSKDGLSWSTDIKKAAWFAVRFENNPKLFKGVISKEDVFAYFSGRGESELVIDYTKLTDVKEVDIVNNEENVYESNRISKKG